MNLRISTYKSNWMNMLMIRLEHWSLKKYCLIIIQDSRLAEWMDIGKIEIIIIGLIVVNRIGRS